MVDTHNGTMLDNIYSLQDDAGAYRSRDLNVNSESTRLPSTFTTNACSNVDVSYFLRMYFQGKPKLKGGTICNAPWDDLHKCAVNLKAK